MSIVIIVILVSLQITSLAIQFASGEGKLLDNRVKGIKRINNRGWIVVVFSAITVFLTLLLYNIQINENEKALFIQSKRIEEYHLLEIEALAKYGLKFDSSQTIIEKIVSDIPAKKEVPILEICSTHPSAITIEKYDSLNNEMVFALWICSLDASAKDIDLKVRLVIKDKNGNYLLVNSNDSEFFLNETIGLGKALQGYEVLTGTLNDIDAVFFYFHGTHANNVGQKFSDSFWAAYSMKRPDVPKNAHHFGKPTASEYKNLKRYERK